MATNASGTIQIFGREGRRSEPLTGARLTGRCRRGPPSDAFPCSSSPSADSPTTNPPDFGAVFGGVCLITSGNAVREDILPKNGTKDDIVLVLQRVALADECCFPVVPAEVAGRLPDTLSPIVDYLSQFSHRRQLRETGGREQLLRRRRQGRWFSEAAMLDHHDVQFVEFPFNPVHPEVIHKFFAEKVQRK